MRCNRCKMQNRELICASKKKEKAAHLSWSSLAGCLRYGGRVVEQLEGSCRQVLLCSASLLCAGLGQPAWG